MTATFGGVIRDTLLNDIPVIFHKEIYATACIIGAIIFLVLNRFRVPSDMNYIITIGIVIAIRLIAVKFRLQLPPFKERT
jgi:uncharacterized membrane protein YeiH